MYILDTHTLLWFFDEVENLSSRVKNIIESELELFVSIITFWEIAIKQNIGKLKIEQSPSDLMLLTEQQEIGILQISAKHLDVIKTLEKIHSDPFDRFIIAQAQCENLTILTRDSIILQYKVKTLW